VQEKNTDTSSVDVLNERWMAVNDSPFALIVDDEIEINEEISFKLSNHGFQCLVAHAADTALTILEKEPRISIVISDIRMPGMSGIELCKEIKNRYEGKRDLSLLMVTGHAGIDEVVEALKVGVLDFLMKPLRPHQLVHAVRRADEHVRWNFFV